MLLVVAFACFAVLLASWLIMPERASENPELTAPDPFKPEAKSSPVQA